MSPLCCELNREQRTTDGWWHPYCSQGDETSLDDVDFWAKMLPEARPALPAELAKRQPKQAKRWGMADAQISRDVQVGSHVASMSQPSRSCAPLFLMPTTLSHIPPLPRPLASQVAFISRFLVQDIDDSDSSGDESGEASEADEALQQAALSEVMRKGELKASRRRMSAEERQAANDAKEVAKVVTSLVGQVLGVAAVCARSSRMLPLHLPCCASHGMGLKCSSRTGRWRRSYHSMRWTRSYGRAPPPRAGSYSTYRGAITTT